MNNLGIVITAIAATIVFIGVFEPGTNILAEKEMPFATVSKDVYGGGKEAKNVVRPEGDAMFIELHLGEKPTGGYSIEVKGVKEFPDMVIVRTERTHPGNCAVAQAFTQPFHIIKIPKTSKPIFYEYTDKTAVC